MAKILVLGATGYIGGRLVPHLLARKHQVRCLVRSPKKIASRQWDSVEVVPGDVLQRETIGKAFEGIDLVFYLVHSMSGRKNEFEHQDRIAAENVGFAARQSGIQRWMNLITPIPVSLARNLIESLRSETICENDVALQLFSFTPMNFREAVRRALEKTQEGDLETKWTAASAPVVEADIDPSHMLTEEQVLNVPSSAENLFRVVSSLGGKNGWLFGNWLWRLRGFLDKQLGGVGLRRGRRHAAQIAVGEALDFWRVEDIEPGRRLLLRAEMKVPGRALARIPHFARGKRTFSVRTDCQILSARITRSVLLGPALSDSPDYVSRNDAFDRATSNPPLEFSNLNKPQN